ncbi:hypothetical protein Tco_0224051 [Tanacetum coccineum]
MAVRRRGCRGTAAGGKGTKWRVEARDYGDRIDRVTSNLFELGRKSSPENFSGGCGGVAGGCRILVREREELRVHDHDQYQDAICEHHEEHEMHADVQPNYVVDSHADYTSDSNMILYDQYVKDNVMRVVQSNVSFVPNDAYMMIYNDMYEPHAQSVSKTTRNIVVDNSLTAKLATYKEQVELYERRARFELTEREQKIDE